MAVMKNPILKLALPAIVSNITVPLLGLCDTTISGHLGNPSFIGAIAVGSMMMNVVFWLCGFLRMGTTALSAQAYGADNAPLKFNVLLKGFEIAAVISAVVLLFQVPLLRLMLELMAPESDVASLAATYFSICVWQVPAQLGVMVISGWFVGQQNTVIPMGIAVGINVVNIILSLTFVFGLDLGFKGIAMGTLCANWVGLTGAAIALPWRKFVKKGSALKWSRFFSLNVFLFFRSVCIMSVTFAVTAIGADLGDITLAANAVMMQFFMFFSYFMDGFAFAGEALVGKDYGAHNIPAVHHTVKVLLLWGVGLSVSFFIIYLLGGEKITSLITDEVSVQQKVWSLRGWLWALPPLTVAAFIFDGIFIGLARAKDLFITTFIATVLFFALTGLYRESDKSVMENVLWLAFESYLFARGILLGITYLVRSRKQL